jgi:hypothetical protein
MTAAHMRGWLGFFRSSSIIWHHHTAKTGIFSLQIQTLHARTYVHAAATRTGVRTPCVCVYIYSLCLKKKKTNPEFPCLIFDYPFYMNFSL